MLPWPGVGGPSYFQIIYVGSLLVGLPASWTANLNREGWRWETSDIIWGPEATNGIWYASFAAQRPSFHGPPYAFRLDQFSWTKNPPQRGPGSSK